MFERGNKSDVKLSSLVRTKTFFEITFIDRKNLLDPRLRAETGR